MSEIPVLWLLDSTCEAADAEKLEAAVSKEAGCQSVSIRDHILNRTDDMLNAITNTCVVYHGPVQYAAKVRGMRNWTPAAYADLPAYECTTYYPELRPVLLNRRYVMLPYGDLLARKSELFDMIGYDQHLFIRPNCVDKAFPGGLVSDLNYKRTVVYMGNGNVASNELVVVAEPVNILSEWRFFVVDGEIITGSQYRRAGAKHRECLRDLKAIDIRDAYDCAIKAVKLYQPEAAFTVDVARVPAGDNPKCYVVEIGPFSAAGLYDSDASLIVAAVNKAARREWAAKQKVEVANV